LEALSYTLSVNRNREPAPPELLAALQQIEVETGVDGADMMRLRLAIGPKDDRTGWTVVDSGVFERLTPIRLAINVGGGPPELLADALVTEVSMTFSDRPGESVLNVVAMDTSMLLNLEQRTRHWPDKSDSQIASEIFAESSECEHGRFGYKLVPEVKSTTRERREDDQKVVQRGTDMNFLRYLTARNENYVVYLATDPESGNIKGHFHPKRLESEPQGELRVNRGADTNVDSFDVSYNMMLPAVVQGAGTDADTQKVVAPREATAMSIRRQLLQGSKPTLDGKCPRRVLLTQTGLFERGDLQPRAQAEANRNAQNAIRASGQVTTAAYGGLLHPDRTVSVTGVGPEFSGRYYVESVSHALSGDGYTQRFSLSRNALGRGG
jgi:phage protein D